MPRAKADAVALRQENESLRQENLRLRSVVEVLRSRLKEPEDIIRAIRMGEVDALVVEQGGQEAIYAIQQYDAVYRGVFEESFAYGVWLASADGKPLYVSRSFLDLLHSSLREIQEKGVFHFLPRETRERFARDWAHCLRTGGACDFEYTVRLADGSERSIWTHGVLGETKEGLRCWAGVNLDVTERVKTRDELRVKTDALLEADQRKDQFLALLGHELRNPLAAIQNGLHILRLRQSEEPGAREVQQLVEAQVHHLARMVDDLLDVSRITAGKIQLRRERVDLADVIRGAAASVRGLIEEQQHSLTVSVPSSKVYVEADPTRLEQVIVNLLTNAAKFTKPGSRINVTAGREGADAVVRVRDNGVGIRPDMLAKIFELFVQDSQQLDRPQGGLGIGLTLVRQLVRMHGGTVTALSDGPGKGSEFVVRLPALAEVADAPRTPILDGAIPGTRRRVLVAEDSKDAARILQMLLGFWGHEVRVVHDGPSVLTACPQYHPEVLLLDIGLPGMNGYDVARELVKQPGAERPLIVAMTGYGQEEDRQRALEAGCDLHMTKPVDPGRLQAFLASMSPKYGTPPPT